MKLLSIIIPTKNRQEYCIKVIKQILELKNEWIEIVVRDNSDEDSLREQIKDDIGNGKIIYEHFDGVVSFVDNFSLSVELCSGQYVCMIGDDDGVLPNIIDAVKIAVENDYDAIIPGLNSVYIWPSSSPFIKGAEKGYLCISYLKKESRDADPTRALKYLLQNGGQNYMNYDLPRLYHGIVKRDVIDRVKKETGHYFGGLTPDIYMSVALALTCKKVRRLFYPLTISGICPQSGASNSATGKHTGRLENAPHFRGHDNYIWDKKIAPIYSVETIWAETVLHALLDFQRRDLYNSFNIEAVNGLCYINYPQFRSIIVENLKYNKCAIPRTILISYTRLLSKVINKILRRVFRSSTDVRKYYNVEDIQQAVSISKDFI